MWIDFEGIDGSGKTTLSNRVAQRLRESGLDVLHLREGGELGSRLSGLVRGLTRDVRNLALSDRAELLLNCAREVQLWDELLRPALEEGRVVIADRSIYSHLAMAVGGRSVPADAARAVAEFTADGLWPDLVVLVDVEPVLAKARKKCRSLSEDRDPTVLGSRKGLAGSGLPSDMRASLLKLAHNDPTRWLVLANDGATFEQLERLIVADVQRRLNHAGNLAPPTAAELDATPVDVSSTSCARTDFDERTAKETFFAHLAILGQREPGAAACLLAGLSGDEPSELRKRLAFTAPDAVAWSLSGSDDEAAWQMRRTLSPRVPRPVAASLAGLPPESQSRAMALRDELSDDAPAQVALSLSGIDSSRANELRLRLFARVPAAVLESLAGVPSAAGWTLRNALHVDEEAHAHSLLVGLAGDDSPRAWQLRARLEPTETLGVIASLRGLSGASAHAVRERWIDRAPRPVLKSLVGLDDEGAWSLRARWVDRVPEALDGLEDCDDPRAWRLRRQAMKRWRAKTIGSLGALARSEQAEPFLRDALNAAPSDLATLRSLVLVMQDAPMRRVLLVRPDFDTGVEATR